MKNFMLVALAMVTIAIAPALAQVTNNPTVIGKLNQAEFEDSLRPHRLALDAAYMGSLNKDLIAEGTVVLVLKIQGGKVIEAQTDLVRSTLKLYEVHQKIIGICRKMRMPLAKNPAGQYDAAAIAIVQYPLEFKLGFDLTSEPINTPGVILDDGKVKEVFRLGRPAIGKCYLDAWFGLGAAGRAQLNGRLQLKLTLVNGAGIACEEIASGTSIQLADFKTCVASTIKTFRFPICKNGTGVADPRATGYVMVTNTVSVPSAPGDSTLAMGNTIVKHAEQALEYPKYNRPWGWFNTHTYDLGREVAIYRISGKTVAGPSEQKDKKYTWQLRVSSDKANWTTVGTITAIGGVESMFGPITAKNTARYVQIFANGTGFVDFSDLTIVTQ